MFPAALEELCVSDGESCEVCERAREIHGRGVNGLRLVARANDKDADGTGVCHHRQEEDGSQKALLGNGSLRGRQLLGRHVAEEDWFTGADRPSRVGMLVERGEPKLVRKPVRKRRRRSP